jgi:hypothetical protein
MTILRRNMELVRRIKIRHVVLQDESMGTMMKTNSILAGFVATTLLVSSAFAETSAPLPSGRPAGTKDAALLSLGVLPLTLIAGFTTLVIVAGAGGFSSDKAAASPIGTVTVTTTGTSA